jgi:hypothetical protein
VLFLCTGLAATTIIIEFHGDRILLLADSRSSALNVNPHDSPIDDQYCKIYELDGEYLYAETGHSGYTRKVSTDPVHEWNGATEALAAYEDVGDHDLYEIALNWAGRVSNNFAELYRVDEQRVRRMAVQGHLLYGIFAGPDKNRVLRVYLADVVVDDALKAFPPIGYRMGKYEARDKAYSTNPITQELLDGTSDRAKNVAKLWDVKSRTFPKRDRNLRRLEFMVVQTGNFDDGVGGPVNAAEVTSSKATWLQRKTCTTR